MSTVYVKGGYVPRYNAVERATHWTLAVAFIVAGLSGLALFHPVFWFLTGLFGGGVASKNIHPWAGLVMCAAFLPMAVWYWRDNLIRSYDYAWLKRLPDVLLQTGGELPPVDKYNPGQKMLFFTIVSSLLLLLITGFVLWFDTDIKISATIVRLSGFVHAVAAFMLYLGMIVHIYSATLWIRGSMRAIVRGHVHPAWARHHHPLWYYRVTGKKPPAADRPKH